ncbi:hypothetical protein CEP54_006660 [Fusarium duplospermum]|uniref:Uncharacterized protein n=1 Tax=Fusarium duplospermum TaxID=1325734 RepID=A0A428Q5Y8_9HYPO|nr:hypothetical protein CEP54_006660 [Fusarium duplospermum]
MGRGNPRSGGASVEPTLPTGDLGPWHAHKGKGRDEGVREVPGKALRLALESAVLIQGPEGSGADPLATTSDRAQNHITETEYPSTGSSVVKMVTKGYGG